MPFEKTLALPAVLLTASLGLVSVREEPPEPVVRGEFERFLVRYEDTVWNRGEDPIRDVTCDALLPLPSERQRVRWIRLSPHAWSLRHDGHGQHVATATVAELPPGEAVTFSWIASVELCEERHDAAAAGTAAADGSEPDYLGDTHGLGLGTEAVRRAAEEARARAAGDRPVDLARAALAHVQERISYDLDGRWDPAPVVLERGSGSCSESVYALLAVTRSLGLRARWTGGTLLRRGGPPGRTLDRVFHRIAEIEVPGHGWVPAEATAPDRGGEPGSEFGRLPRAFLLTGRGDGSGDAGAGALYFSRHSWRERVRPGRPSPGGWDKRAWWLSGADDSLALGDARAGLPDGHAPSYPRAELMLVDALRFGPALDAQGRPLPGAREAAAWDGHELARQLFRAGHPEALRAARAALRCGPEIRPEVRPEVEELVRVHCTPALAEAFLPLLDATDARFEEWWRARADRVHGIRRGLVGLRGR